MSRRRPPAGQRASTQAEIGIDYDRLAVSLVKALALPQGATATPFNQLMPAPGSALPGAPAGLARPLAPGGWVDPLVAFGPGAPVRPAAIDPLDPATGRPLPRRYDYATSFNLPGVDDRMVPWTILRRLADTSIVRRCIEIRKAEMVSMDRDIAVSPLALQGALALGASGSDLMRSKAIAAGDPQALLDQATRQAVGKKSAEQAIRSRNAEVILRLKTWWENPDRINGYDIHDWMNVVLEEHFVLDALTIYPHLDLGGRLHSLEVIDGSTIKPLLDHRGGVPQAPNPAYQQLLHGFPRGEFTATSDATDEFDRDTLIYAPRYRRTFSPYGYSNVEQAIVNTDMYLKRQEWIRAEYTAGVVPELLIEVDTPMTPDNLLAYEAVFNDLLSGNTAERHRAKVFPQGFKPQQLNSFEERYRSDYDLHLIRLIGNDFDVMPTELGFPPSGGLGGKGLSDGEENITFRKGNRPLAKWLVSVQNRISRHWLGMPAELTHQFLGLEAEDEALAMDTMEKQFRSAGLTANEMRDAVGLPRFTIPDADRPFIITGRDIVPLEGSFDRAQLAVAAEFQGGGGGGQEGPKGSVPGAAATTTPGKQSSHDPVKIPVPSDNGDNAGSAKAAEAELAAFKTYVKNRRKRGRPWRDFEFEHIDPMIGSGILNKLGQDGDEQQLGDCIWALERRYSQEA